MARRCVGIGGHRTCYYGTRSCSGETGRDMGSRHITIVKKRYLQIVALIKIDDTIAVAAGKRDAFNRQSRSIESFFNPNSRVGVRRYRAKAQSPLGKPPPHWREIGPTI